ncbi:hypothetical protein [Flammeovirga kamogawensis]|uniref:DUF4595 domain-containing protein n=1 Tax=Flammeovirga kamogawensis TaxID=373891 RepID=A0ABX8GPN3_9BACT|nr:hypothetical protein [Flammeovirga kamogawensis]MBB6463493.1 hypothetical protein [Flammeovirga kamogawensis]QWG05581.1 hypothetical protein KM029_09315 [Flammeovirga kamogawensis]TRX67412.1 hypothetical protein EO216_04350 [Flammeovirga kamogawensis]
MRTYYSNLFISAFMSIALLFSCTSEEVIPQDNDAELETPEEESPVEESADIDLGDGTVFNRDNFITSFNQIRFDGEVEDFYLWSYSHNKDENGNLISSEINYSLIGEFGNSFQTVEHISEGNVILSSIVKGETLVDYYQIQYNIKYTYDNNGFIIGSEIEYTRENSTDISINKWSYEYNEEGLLTKATLLESTFFEEGTQSESFELKYNSENQVIAISRFKNNEEFGSYSYEYENDKIKNRSSSSPNTENSFVYNYTYDSEERVASLLLKEIVPQLNLIEEYENTYTYSSDTYEIEYSKNGLLDYIITYKSKEVRLKLSDYTYDESSNYISLDKRFYNEDFGYSRVELYEGTFETPELVRAVNYLDYVIIDFINIYKKSIEIYDSSNTLVYTMILQQDNTIEVKDNVGNVVNNDDVLNEYKDNLEYGWYTY